MNACAAERLHPSARVGAANFVPLQPGCTYIRLSDCLMCITVLVAVFAVQCSKDMF